MRTIILTDFAGELRKLIWVTENRTGISAGSYEIKSDVHATYHADGTYHYKLIHRGRKIKISAPKQRPPLAKIKAKEHLLGTAAFYTDDTMKRLPRFTPDGRADTIVILGQSVFRNIRCVAFNSYVLHRDHEATFLAGAYSDYEDKSFMLVTVSLFALDLFPKHKVGIIVYRGRGT